MALYNLEIIANSDVMKQRLNEMLDERGRIEKMNKLLGNSALSIPQMAYQEMDKQIIEYAYRVDGGDIIEDLNRVITPVDIGTTLKTYNKGSNVSRNDPISMDGHPDLGFDHITYTSDADPLPVMSEAWGANWRDVAGYGRIDVNVLLDTQLIKMKQHSEDIVKYTLDGSTRIDVSGFKGEGLRNHRNTFKIDLGASGLNVDLTTATLAQYGDFFHKTLRTQMDNNHVRYLDKLWVSPEIYNNLTMKAFVANAGDGDFGRSNLDYLGTNIPVRNLADVAPSYALKGNEFLGYVRDKQYIEVPVGKPTSITPLIRQYWNDNYNFRVDTIRGIQVKSDSSGKSGVFYGAVLS